MIGEEIQKVNIHKAITCSEETTLTEIATTLRDNKERRIFVTNKEEELIGIITTTDLVYKALCNCETLQEKKAKDIMTTPVQHLDIEEDLDKALEIMNKLQAFTCPITQQKKLLGTISYHELVQHVFKTLE